MKQPEISDPVQMVNNKTPIHRAEGTESETIGMYTYHMRVKTVVKRGISRNEMKRIEEKYREPIIPEPMRNWVHQW
jgi:hypothetical protein